MSRRSQRLTSITSKIIILTVAISLGLCIAYAEVSKERIISGLANSKDSGLVGDNAVHPTHSEKNISDSNDTLDARVDQIIDAMSLEQKVGQMLMVGFSGTEPDYYITRMINLRHIGGVVLFGRNLENSTQVAELNNQLQKLTLGNNDLPLFIAVDQEGGEVSRFQDIITTFPSPPQLGQKKSAEATELASRDTALELRAMGVNVNLAPVIDVAVKNSIMEERVYSNDPKVVAELGVAAVAGYRKGGVIPCGKHFPGLGRSIYDSHARPVEISVNLAEISETDLLPFRQVIQESIEMILVSHALYPSLDADNPASISPTIQQYLLRDMLGYQGLILSDDLEMGAVASKGTIAYLAVQAVKAGTDILLICHTPEKQKEAYEAIVAAVKDGEIDQQRINDSLKRIISLKLKWELEKNGQVTVDAEEISAQVNSPEHRQDAEKIRNLPPIMGL